YPSLRAQLLRYRNEYEASHWKIPPLAKDALPYEISVIKEDREWPLRETLEKNIHTEVIPKQEEQRDHLTRKAQVQVEDLPVPTLDRPVRVRELTTKS